MSSTRQLTPAPGEASAADELEELLSESPAAAARRAAHEFSPREGDALVLYGAGGLGRLVAAKLRAAGVEPAAFADDTPEKRGALLEGLRVLAPTEAAAEFGGRALFAVTIFNPAASYLDIKRRLEGATGGARVVSFLSLAWKYPDQFLPHYQFVLPQDVLAAAADIRRGFAAFSDEESRRQFVAHLRLRLRLDFGALPESSRGDYFPAGVVPELPPDTIFVDCGAFDGDTARRFVEHQRGRFGEVYAFEPDARNAARLREYAASLGPDAAARVHVFQAAAGARRGRARFDSTGDMGAALSSAGGEEVEVLPVQEVVQAAGGAAVYLKFDVEGAEAEALGGAEELIRRVEPVVAVSVYHRPADLWQLPLYLRALCPAHGLFLRTQGCDGMDVVCYAVPGALGGGVSGAPGHAADAAGDAPRGDAATGGVRAVAYEAARKSEWDEFVASSKNGVFLFRRDYVEYHADRYPDASLMFYDAAGRLVGLLPATAREGVVSSHGGLTFGGVVSGDSMKAALMLDVFAAMIARLRADGHARLVYKAVPHIYHRAPAEEDLYALFRHGARLVRRDLSSTLDLSARLPFSKGRKWAVKQARKNGLAVVRSSDFETFMAIEERVLGAKYGKRPVHTAAELELLAGRFPDHIKLFAAARAGEMLAGVVMYESGPVAHAQYIAAGEEGKRAGAADLILDHLINDYYSGKRYFDFGISTEQGGRHLNPGLAENKQGFGARAVVYDFYELDLAGD